MASIAASEDREEAFLEASKDRQMASIAASEDRQEASIAASEDRQVASIAASEERTRNTEKILSELGQAVTRLGGQIDSFIAVYERNVQGSVDPTSVEAVDVEGRTFLTVQEADDDDSGPTIDPNGTPTTPEPVTSAPRVSRLDSPPVKDDYEDDVSVPGCFGVEGSDQWCFFAGEATSYAAWRLNTVNFEGEQIFHNRYPDNRSVVWGHARNWDNAAGQLGITVDDTPAVGAVVQSDGTWSGSFGLVGYVERVNLDEDGSIESFVFSAMNVDSRAVSTEPSTWTLERGRTCPSDGCWPTTRFIHIKDLANE